MQVQLDANSVLRKQSDAQIGDITNDEQIFVTGTQSGNTIQATNVQIGGAGDPVVRAPRRPRRSSATRLARTALRRCPHQP